MAIYSISLAVEIETDSYEGAYAVQESLAEYLLNRTEVLSVIEIDVEELDE